ncbi:hypothetical protein ACFV1A_21015 [Streptomyces seoulensis]|uniref:Secreted protein n=1 Tax=Streptomyces seoulensis TaxID=73044 RepID=A0A4P6U6A9_STRSO|nr:hypothetical protein [Streptomyces seoulensis]QBJ93748.1 hypothetical protein D0Z67_28085 [Streptomyces seoulensis]
MRGSLVGTTVTLAAGALLTAAMTTASASPPTTAPVPHRTAPVLVDCQFKKNVRPADFILACGDGNSRLSGLKWVKWDSRSAVAEGVNVVNDCKPYCAKGVFRSYHVTVRLDRPAAWQKSPDVKRWTRMSVTYDDARPKGFTQTMVYPLWS